MNIHDNILQLIMQLIIQMLDNLSIFYYNKVIYASIIQFKRKLINLIVITI